jgi:hypothetical protein
MLYVRFSLFFAEVVAKIETLPGPERIDVLLDIMGQTVRTLLRQSPIENLK